MRTWWRIGRRWRRGRRNEFEEDESGLDGEAVVCWFAIVKMVIYPEKDVDRMYEQGGTVLRHFDLVEWLVVFYR